MSDSSFYHVNKLEHALLRQCWISEGRLDAFAFAVKCHADVGAIEAEIKEREELIAELLGSQPHNGPMALGASPRIYREAYLAGLREALVLIQVMRGDKST